MTTIDLSRLTPLQFARLDAALRRHVWSRTDFTWLYAIQAGESGPVKLGVTVNIAERMRTLQQANAEELKGLAAWRAMPGEEKALHEHFADIRIRGEWFQPTPDLLDYVAREGCTYCDWP